MEFSLPMLSIIISTLNEERYLPILLESIKKQEFDGEGEEDKSSSSPSLSYSESSVYEIIVADAGSEDKTMEIARSFGCKIVLGGLPAKGRNEGAKAAKGNLLLFLDADVVLPKGFLEESLNEFKKRKLAVASFCLIPQTKKFLPKLAFHLFYNLPIIILGRFLAHGAMGIFVKKEVFNKVGGFDEEIKLAEDHYFVRQAKKVGKFGIIRSAKLLIPLRRFEKDGYFKTGLRYLICGLFMLSGKPAKSKFFDYRLGHYSKKKKDKLK